MLLNQKPSTPKSPLSDKELEDYFFIIGRELDRALLDPALVRTFLMMEQRDKRRAQRYNKKVWSHRNVQEYLSEKAHQCAEQAASYFFGDRRISWDRNFLLTNPHGKRYAELGVVHFRTPFDYGMNLSNEVLEVDFEQRIAVERIELHRSIQRRGFLNMLATELRFQGCKLLVLQNVMNPSFAYHLYQESLKKESKIILLSGPDTVAFDKEVSPCPTIAWRLGES